MPDAFVYRVRAVSTGWPGGPGLNSFYFAGDEEDLEDREAAALGCVGRVRAGINAAHDLWPEIWSCQVSGAVDMINTDNGDLVAALTVADPAVVVGTVDAGFGPEAAMLCVNLNTSAIIDGRRVRGRVFLGPLVIGGNGDGTPTTTQATIASSSILGMQTATGTPNRYMVWSRRRGISVDHPTGLGGSRAPVEGVAVRDKFAILRSRRD